MRQGPEKRYWLIADPRNGLVVRRSHAPANFHEVHLMSLSVPGSLWKGYRKGDMVQAADLDPQASARWVQAVEKVRMRDRMNPILAASRQR